MHKAGQPEEEDEARVVVDEAEERKKRIEKKRALKLQFDAQYDAEGNTHYDELKKEVDAQAVLNRQEFDGLDDHLRYCSSILKLSMVATNC